MDADSGVTGTMTELERLYSRRRMGRKITGIAAMLLPFEADGTFATDAYQVSIREIVDAGLTPAVNMDTGYVNLLTPDERALVLELARQATQDPFVAGVFIEDQPGDPVELYRREMERVAAHGGTPILFQTARMHALTPREKVAVYAMAAKGFEAVHVFELGKMFAPNGEIWPIEVFEEILQIPEIKGAKHSSLDCALELERLALRDRLRPEFQIFTGNDLGSEMVEYGSDYLLGLAAFSPEKFAERDRLWEAGDFRYRALSDALQHLGNTAFRPPVPAYKHSAAIFRHLLGKIPSPRTHPRSPSRPPWEAELLRDCAVRLELL